MSILPQAERFGEKFSASKAERLTFFQFLFSTCDLLSGPGKAWSAKEQGEYLFKLAGKKPWLIGVPVGLMDGIISVFDGLTKLFPNLEVIMRSPF